MAQYQETREAFRVLNDQPYMADGLGYLADGNSDDAGDVLPLLLTKQEVAQLVIALMSVAAMFDQDHRPSGAVDALGLAVRIGDQAFTEQVNTPA